MTHGSHTHPLLVVANRLPVARTATGFEAAAGGLVTALRPVIDEQGGMWVGWDDDPDGIPPHVDGLNAQLFPVGLDQELVDGFYHGFTNRFLWPLFHDLIVSPVYQQQWWDTYVTVNQRFASHVSKAIAQAKTVPLVWIHDYHLMLLPELIRARYADAPIGFFLHIPFPPPELVARIPGRVALLRGMLGANAVAFHTDAYRQNFLRAVAQFLPDVTIDGAYVRLEDGRTVRVDAHPISIDVNEFAALATAPETLAHYDQLRTQFADRRVLLGVDRLDYTKGIRHRLRAVEHLYESDPSYAKQVVFIQIAVPSRDDVAEYQALRTNVETELGRINGRFTAPGYDVPVHYLYRSLSRYELAAYYLLADVMCVTPLKDGMNLVAKEFVTVQHAATRDGVLLLSEFCGTAEVFGHDAVLTNPYDVAGQSANIAAALAFTRQDRQDRLERMANRVHAHDVYGWVDDELRTILAP